LLATDGRYGDQGIKAWLEGYYSKTGNALLTFFPTFPDLARGGAVQAAINIDIKPSERLEQLVILSGNALL
jgi:hypothetical protein